MPEETRAYEEKFDAPAPSLKELTSLFLRLGSVAFGDPAAHIAMTEEEFVHRRMWLDHEEFLDPISAANLIPGPNSTELAVHTGYEKAGWKGLVTAGAGFILSAYLDRPRVRLGVRPVRRAARGLRPSSRRQARGHCRHLSGDLVPSSDFYSLLFTLLSLL
jgi:hypothetical protein